MASFPSCIFKVATIGVLSIAATSFIASGCDPPQAHPARPVHESAFAQCNTDPAMASETLRLPSAGTRRIDRPHLEFKECQS